MPKYLSPTESATGGSSPAIYRRNASNDTGRKITFAMLGVALLLLVAGGGWIYLLNNQIQATNRAEADRRAQVGSSQQIASRYAATLADYQATTAQLKFLEVPQSPDLYVPTLLPQVESLAAKYQCQIKSMTPGALASPDPAATGSGSGSGSQPSDGKASKVTGPTLQYQTMPVNLSLSGTYPDVMHFIYDLTRFQKVITVKSVSLHPNDAQPAAGGVKTDPTVSVALVLSAYVFPADQPASATPGAGATVSASAPAQTPTNISPVDHPMAAAESIAAESRADVKITGLSVQPPTSTLPFNPIPESSR